MSSLSARSLAQAKVRRQKQILAVGSVILLALLGYQVPKVLGGGGKTAAPDVTATAPLTSSPPAVAPGKLPDTDRLVVEHDSDQLLSFGLFKSKDPFVQQLSGEATAGPSSPAATTPVSTTPAPRPRKPKRGGSGSGAASATTTTTGTTTTGTTTSSSTVPSPSTTPVATVPPTTTSGPTPPPPASPATSVLISTNGACESVALNGTFPRDEDIFRVVWIARDGKSIKIAVVGGSYDSGQAAATLKLGDELTLVNTSDGTRYVISLEKKCNVQSSSAGRTATQPPLTTTTTTPTTTATTPIVTDSLDTTTPTTG